MRKRVVTLIYPQTLVTEPVIWRVSRDFDLVPNIRRARVTETTGECTVEFTGSEEDLQRAVAYLEGLGITVEGR